LIPHHYLASFVPWSLFCQKSEGFLIAQPSILFRGADAPIYDALNVQAQRASATGISIGEKDTAFLEIFP
jgi:hypothetical protein